MGHLSIDRRPHMHFPLMLHYWSSIYLIPYICCLKGDMIITTMRPISPPCQPLFVCNMSSTWRPVLWPWWFPTPGRTEDEKLSWELVMTRPDTFDLIDLWTHTHTQWLPHTHVQKCWGTKREEEDEHLRAARLHSHRHFVRRCRLVFFFFFSPEGWSQCCELAPSPFMSGHHQVRLSPSSIKKQMATALWNLL